MTYEHWISQSAVDQKDNQMYFTALPVISEHTVGWLIGIAAVVVIGDDHNKQEADDEPEQLPEISVD